MPNVQLVRKKDLSSFRKIAIGTWQDAYDPSVYGTLEIRMDEALKYLAAFREKTGKRLTVTHLVAKGVAAALKRCPDANAVLRYNRIYLRPHVDIFLQVVMNDEGEDKIDLSGAKLERVEEKTLGELVDELEAKVALIRARKDPSLEKTRKSMMKFPGMLMNKFLKLLGFLMYTLNLDLRWAGLPKDPFGSLMITNIGSIGLDIGYVPLVPYSHVPILIALGAVHDAPIVDNGAVVAAKVMKVNATFDHRFIDGYHASVLSKTLRQMLEHPFDSFDNI
ncbi:MAG: 2-oxo acid dehydrogenase subunit E2 [Deltaproteobacteria bacterium]|nr:2-oxo acid dehydrogenase subunit E2 [Deltaproteobacteria bacterium]